jgi:hypothetical protein
MTAIKAPEMQIGSATDAPSLCSEFPSVSTLSGVEASHASMVGTGRPLESSQVTPSREIQNCVDSVRRVHTAQLFGQRSLIEAA